MAAGDLVKLAWATDIHLDFLEPAAVAAFFEQVAAAGADAALISGDIALAASVGPFMSALAERLERPVYFVLGNHDFWGSSVARVEAEMAALTRRQPLCGWLPALGVVALTERTGLLGHDGWYDARLGDPEGTPIRLRDWVRMEDYASPRREDVIAVSRRLGDRAAEHLRTHLALALDRFEHTVVVTHVPPFREAAWHEGRLSGDAWLPWMTCRAAGEALRAAAAARPDRRVTVLCGHTHGAGEARILDNLVVRTGGAIYGSPALQAPLIVT